ncbi:hypothetical protein LTS18_007532, partial [Coniosporium uncinatum]
HSPSAPVLRCRNATQTSVVLEWDPISLATAELRSLSLYRDGQKAGSIPRPLEMQSTKISGLGLDKEFTFHLVLRTSAGTYTSDKLTVRTHKMTELSGITVTAGIMPSQQKAELAETLGRMGGKLLAEGQGVRIDTTHFVTTEGRGREWERAVEMSVPVVMPEWVGACEREGRIVGVRNYYLGSDPKGRPAPTSAGGGGGGGGGQQRQQGQQGQGQQQQQQQPQQQQRPLENPRTEVTPPTPERKTRADASRSRDAVHVNGEVQTTVAESDERPPPPPPKSDAPAASESADTDNTDDAENDDDADDRDDRERKGAQSDPTTQDKDKDRDGDGDGGSEADEDDDDVDSEPAEQLSKGAIKGQRESFSGGAADKGGFDDVQL